MMDGKPLIEWTQSPSIEKKKLEFEISLSPGGHMTRQIN